LAAKSAPKKNLSAIKKVRQAEKHKMHNQAVETSIKTHTKKLEAALSSKNKGEVDTVAKKTISMINKAASKGIIHKNTASRKISRIAKKVSTAFSEGAAG
jgi:small subunit ribosomal protein S20